MGCGGALLSCRRMWSQSQTGAGAILYHWFVPAPEHERKKPRDALVLECGYKSTPTCGGTGTTLRTTVQGGQGWEGTLLFKL